MPPAFGQEKGADSSTIDRANFYTTSNKIIFTLGALFTIVLGAIIFSDWPRSDETLAATYACNSELSWNITFGHSMSDTYGGQVDSHPCVYARATLLKNGQKVYSIANFTGCRDFNASSDLLNGIDDPLYSDHETFPAGAAIVAGVAVPVATKPPPEPPSPYDVNPDQLGFEVSTKSELTPQEFVTASECLLDHRNALQLIFGNIDMTNGPLQWLALINESAPYNHDDDVPGMGQEFACRNGYSYRTSDEDLFALAPGRPDQVMDETGLPVENDKQIAIIGFDGTLYQPEPTSTQEVTLPYPDHRTVNENALPSPLSQCTNTKGLSLAAYLASLKTDDVVYEPPPEKIATSSFAQYAPPVLQGSPQGIAPTPAQDTQCISQYGQSVDAAAQQSVEPDASTSDAVFFSPSLDICVGVIETAEGNNTNFDTFNAATGQTLNVGDNATAFADWSLDTSASTSSSQ